MDAREKTCYGVSWTSAMSADALARRAMRTGDVGGRYRYLCVGVGARRTPFYPEGRRAPTVEERRRGTDFPVCQGLEMLIAEKTAAVGGAGGADAGGGRAETAETTGRARGVARGGTASAPGGEEILARFNKSAGKIASNMRRHAAYVGDGAYGFFVGRR